MTDPTRPVLDCQQCPSFLAQHVVPGTFNRGSGAAMCGSLGRVLSLPGNTPDQNKRTRVAIASSCARYGEPKAPAAQRETHVFLPDPATRAPDAIDDNLKAACSSCGTCKNYVPEHVVVNELGFTTGLCVAKGKLIFTNKMSAEASNCDYRQMGQVRSSSGGLMHLPEYDVTNTAPGSAVAVNRTASVQVDPSEYETDKPVEEGDATAGIRAWRKYEDPDGSGNHIFFPIYDKHFFDDELKELVPVTGANEHPELYIDHFGGMYSLGVAWMELDETPCLNGMSGTGKTELLRHAAWVMQLPFHRISFTSSTEIDEVFGKMLFDPARGTYFHYGRLPKAWGSPGVLCLDEPNTPRDPAVWHGIRPLTDNSKQMVLDMNENERIDRHPDCYMGIALNPAWDTRNVGVLEVADADVNRLFHMYVDLPPEELERKIIKQRVDLDGWSLTIDQMNCLIKTAQDIRRLSDDDQLPVTWAIRQQIKVARALKWFAPHTAYKRAVADWLEPEAQKMMLDQVTANWPAQVNPWTPDPNTPF